MLSLSPQKYIIDCDTVPRSLVGVLNDFHVRFISVFLFFLPWGHFYSLVLAFQTLTGLRFPESVAQSTAALRLPITLWGKEVFEAEFKPTPMDTEVPEILYSYL